MVTSGGIHGVFAICQGLLEPGDEVLVPDPEWPPAQGNVACARAVPVQLPAARIAGLAAGRRRNAAAGDEQDARDLRELAQQPHAAAC